MAIAFVVETGEGLPNSNSFAAIEFISTYAESRGRNDWLTLKEDEKMITAILASDYVNNQYDWRGHLLREGQAMNLPRTGFSMPTGTNSTGVPKCVKNAVAELATKWAFASSGGVITYPSLVDRVDVSNSIKTQKQKLAVMEKTVTYAGPLDLKDVRPFPMVDAMIWSWLLNTSKDDMWGSIACAAVVTGTRIPEVFIEDEDPRRYTGYDKNALFGGEDDNVKQRLS